MQRLFCFGFGFSASFLATRVLRDGWGIAGTGRSDATLAAMQGRGIEPWRFDRGHALPDEALAGTTHLLISVPPDEIGDPVLDLHRDDIAALRTLAWVGYLSTTGVYGDRGGEWVDEVSALHPSLARSQRRVAAEAAWLAMADHGVPVHAFRLAGIYGPGRSAIDTVLGGKAQRIVKPGQVFSRIHAEDIAHVLMASMSRPNPGRIYNVCDDDPAPPQDVIAHACLLLGCPPPPEIPYEDAQMSDMARSFYADNKRVRNDRIKTELGVTLRYPTYREGLRAILAARS